MEEVIYDEDNDFDASTQSKSWKKRKIGDSPEDGLGMSSASNDLSLGCEAYFVEISPTSLSSYNFGSASYDESRHATPTHSKERASLSRKKNKKGVSFSAIQFLGSEDDYDPHSESKANLMDKLESKFHFDGHISTARSFVSDVSGLQSSNTGAASRLSRTPRRKDIFQSSQSYASLLADTSTIQPSKMRYSGALHRQRSMEKMIHPVERHTKMNLLPTENIHSAPSKTFVSQFDYVVVFPFAEFEEKGQTPDAKYIMHSMLLAGLELYPYRSLSGDQLFVLIRCPRGVLELLAEKSEILFPTNEPVLRELLAHGDPENKIAPVKIRHEPEITHIEPLQYIYLRYKALVDQRLYLTSNVNDGHLFPKYLRLKLIHFLLTSPRRLGGCNLEISRLLLRKKILSIFPLHDSDICQEILDKCMNIKTLPWNAPIEDLRQYLGEKISLYLVFLGHLSIWLVPIGVIGFGAQVVIWSTGDYSHPVAPIYTVLLIIWSIIMLGFWKRQQSYTALTWGMTQFVNTQYERPEFMGELQLNSFINGREMLYFPRNDFRQRIALSLTAISVFVLLVVGVITGIYLLRFFAQSALGSTTIVVAAVLNVIEILTLNFVYQIIAVKLTNQENHRTDTEYENALIVKVFVFQFINSYASLFYLAFIAAYLPDNVANDSNNNYRGQCGDVNCMRPLALSLGLIMITRMVFKNGMDLLLPYVNYLQFLKKKSRFLQFSTSFKEGTASSSRSDEGSSEKLQGEGIPSELEMLESHGNNGKTEKKSKKILSPPEMDFLLMEYDTILENVRKYSDTAIQYGYTVLFIACLPVAPLLTVFYNYLKVKFQSWKLLMMFQRPHPSGAQSIESWQTIFTLLSVIAVVTNAGIISFTMDVIGDYPYSFRIWIFIAFQWLMLSIQYATSTLIPEEPETVQIQKLRMNFISEKVILKYPDEDYDEMMYMSDDDDEDDEYILPVEFSRSDDSSPGDVLSEGGSEENGVKRIGSRNFIIKKNKRLTQKSAKSPKSAKSLAQSMNGTSNYLSRASSATGFTNRKTGKFYLKRLPYGFYQPEEVLDPCTKLWRNIIECIFPVNEFDRAEQLARNGSTSHDEPFGRLLEKEAPEKEGSGSGKHGTKGLPPQPLNQVNSNQKRVYRQRLRFNDESVSSKLAPLDVMDYPHTEDLSLWKLPISKDVIEYEPDLDLYKLDF